MSWYVVTRRGRPLDIPWPYRRRLCLSDYRTDRFLGQAVLYDRAPHTKWASRKFLGLDNSSSSRQASRSQILFDPKYGAGPTADCRLGSPPAYDLQHQAFRGHIAGISVVYLLEDSGRQGIGGFDSSRMNRPTKRIRQPRGKGAVTARNRAGWGKARSDRCISSAILGSRAG